MRELGIDSAVAIMSGSSRLRLLCGCSKQMLADAQALLWRRSATVKKAGPDVVATALVDTGSRMDDVIYEEFKGTGNMEIHLDRRMAEKRTCTRSSMSIAQAPAREELLIKPDVLQKDLGVFRKLLYPMDDMEAMEFLLDKIKATKSNADFFDSMRRV